jgi:signal transduction histidine kinase
MNAKVTDGDWPGRYARLRQLYEVSQVIHSTIEPEAALDLIVREAVRLTRAASGSVVLVNPTTGFLEIQAAHGLPPEAFRLRLRVGEGITGWVARTGRPARVGDVSKDPRYVRVRAGVRSELAVPWAEGGAVRGVINVDADREEAFSVEDQALLEELAVQAAGVVRNTWRYEQLRHKARLSESLASVGRALNSTLSLDETLQSITREACVMMGGKMCSLHLLDEDGEGLELRASHGAGAAYLERPRLSLADSLLGTVVRRRKPLQVENVQTSIRYQRVETARREGLISLLSVPLLFRGAAIGTLSVYTAEPKWFSNEEIRTVATLAELSATAIARARLYERLAGLEGQLRQSERLSVLGLLAAEIAHEIRNPLAVMKMLYHSLDLRFAPGDPRARDAQVMEEKMDQLNRIIERILDFARSPEPRIEAADVNRLVEDLALLLRPKLKQQRVRLELALDPRLPAVAADATQLEQAFLNLALNAVEAMPEGGGLTIRTQARRLVRSAAAATHVAVTFRDTGEGMSEEQQRRLFGALLSTTKRQGTGLGLAIVSRIVQAHRGRIRVASRPGAGTTIRVVLPIEGAAGVARRAGGEPRDGADSGWRAGTAGE